jgi:hypothetical protein
LWRELAMQIGMRFITEARSRRVVSLPIFAAMLEFIGSEHRLMPKLSTSRLSLSRLSRYQLHRSHVQANKNIREKIADMRASRARGSVTSRPITSTSCDASLQVFQV